MAALALRVPTLPMTTIAVTVAVVVACAGVALSVSHSTLVCAGRVIVARVAEVVVRIVDAVVAMPEV
jgi:hypothetical protein